GTDNPQPWQPARTRRLSRPDPMQGRQPPCGGTKKWASRFNSRCCLSLPAPVATLPRINTGGEFHIPRDAAARAWPVLAQRDVHAAASGTSLPVCQHGHGQVGSARPIVVLVIGDLFRI